MDKYGSKTFYMMDPTETEKNKKINIYITLK